MLTESQIKEKMHLMNLSALANEIGVTRHILYQIRDGNNVSLAAYKKVSQFFEERDNGKSK